MPAKGTAQWQGDLKGGSGTFKAGDSIAGDYSSKSRFEDGPGANPEQLIGAAHAACFSMALSSILAEAGHAPDSVDDRGHRDMRPLAGRLLHRRSRWRRRARTEDRRTATMSTPQAQGRLPGEKALAGVPEVALDTSLGGHDAAAA